MNQEITTKKKFRLKNPNGYFTIMLLIIVSVLATWFLPSGSYERYVDEATGRELVDAESFQYTERTPVGILDALEAIPKGIAKSVGVIAFIFLVSGSIEVVKKTGAIDAGINRLIYRFKGKDLPLLIGTTIIFSLTGTLLGFAQQIIPFIVLGVALATSLGYDRMVGFHIVRTSAWIGFAASTINPYVITIAQEMAGLPVMSGLGYRIVCYVVFMLIGIVFIVRYAKKVKADPTKSALYGYEGDVDPSAFQVDAEAKEFNGRHKIILAIFALSLAGMVFGAIKFSWGTTKMAALLLGCAIICGFVGKMGPNTLASTFSKGMERASASALIAGFTNAIAIILSSGGILDTIIYGLLKPLSHMNGIFTVISIFIMYCIITFFIGSASGRAAATLPILIPVCDILGISRQTLVLCASLGAGITNMLWPNMIYVIAVADIPYDRWFKHIIKLDALLAAAGAILVVIAYLMGYGPF